MTADVVKWVGSDSILEELNSLVLCVRGVAVKASIDNMFRNNYDNDISTWSPNGRIFQVSCCGAF